MPSRARVTVDLTKVAENSERVVANLPGIEVVAVTKVTCGTPQVARAMLAGGARALGESRLENIERLRAAGIRVPIWLLRAATPETAEDAVRLAEVSVASELVSLDALDRAAAAQGKRHGIVAMIDVGDLREGMMPAELPAFIDRIGSLPHLRLDGIGTSLTCYGGVVPSVENLGELVALAHRTGARLGRRLIVSGGSSTSIPLVAAGLAPLGIDNLRIGEAILLGVDPSSRERILDLHTDAITVEAPVIECRVKPSKPIGACAQDAFGGTPVFEDRGLRRRAICALGRQDTPPEGLRPLDPGVTVLGASSDHLVLDVDEMARPPAIGESLRFVPGYSATLALFTSPYVDKAYVGGA